MFWKRVILSVVMSVLAFATAYAETIKAKAVTPFSTESPSQTMQFKVIEEVDYDDITLPEGSLVTANVMDVISPKRLKRNATFTLVPQTYTDNAGQIHKFTYKYLCKYSLPIDKKDMAIKAGTTVGGFFVKGLSLGVSAVRGAIDNDEDNRFKSAAVRVYDDSPISMVENGQEINLHEGDIFYLKFKTKTEIKEEEEHTEPNYTYTEPAEE